MRSGKALSIIFGIITSILLALTILSLVMGQDQPCPEANVITQEFMEEYAHWRMWKELGGITLIWTFICAVPVVIGLVWETLDLKNNPIRAIEGLVIFLAIIIITIRALPVSISEIQDMASCTPQAHRASISSTFYRDVHRRHGNIRHYYVTYSNGITKEIRYYEYDTFKAGDEFYLIMCGNTIVGRFDTDIYTLQYT